MRNALLITMLFIGLVSRLPGAEDVFTELLGPLFEALGPRGFTVFSLSLLLLVGLALLLERWIHSSRQSRALTYDNLIQCLDEDSSPFKRKRGAHFKGLDQDGLTEEEIDERCADWHGDLLDLLPGKPLFFVSEAYLAGIPFLERGQADRARDLAEQALALVEKRFPDEAAWKIHEVRWQFAKLFLTTDQGQHVQELISDAAENLLDDVPADSERALDVLEHMAVYLRDEEHDKGQDFYQGVASRWEPQLQGHPHLTKLYLFWGRARLDAEDWPAAARLLARARSIAELFGPEDNEDLENCLYWQGYALLRQGQGEDALATLRQAEEIAATRPDATPHDRAAILEAQIEVHLEQGDNLKAVDCTRRFILALVEAHGPKSPQVAKWQGNLAVLLFRVDMAEEGEDAEAESRRLFEEARQSYADTKPADPKGHSLLLKKYASACIQWDELERAASLIEEAAAIEAAIPDHKALDGIDLMYRRKELLQAQDRQREALDIAKEILLIQEAELGEDHPSALEARDELAEAFTEVGNYERAIELRKDSLETLVNLAGEDNILVALKRNALAVPLLHNGDYDEAEPILWEALEYLQRQSSVMNPQLGNVQWHLGVLYFKTGRTGAAVQHIEDAKDIFSVHLGAEHAMTQLASSALAVARSGDQHTIDMFQDQL